MATVAAAVAVEKDKAGLIRAHLVKARDASPDQPFAFRVETREVGTDAKGRPVVAAIAVAADSTEVTAAHRPRTARDVAASALRPLATIGAGISMDDAIETCIAAGVSSAGSREDQRRAARRTITELVRAGEFDRAGDHLRVRPAISEAEADEVFGAAQ